jgi:hypothetical protein
MWKFTGWKNQTRVWKPNRIINVPLVFIEVITFSSPGSFFVFCVSTIDGKIADTRFHQVRQTHSNRERKSTKVTFHLTSITLLFLFQVNDDFNLSTEMALTGEYPHNKLKSTIVKKNWAHLPHIAFLLDFYKSLFWIKKTKILAYHRTVDLIYFDWHTIF